MLAWQGKCRSLASQARHLTGQVQAERLRVSELSNKLAEREAEVERLLLHVKEVRQLCTPVLVAEHMWQSLFVSWKELSWYW
jgi:hypothetical protein